MAGGRVEFGHSGARWPEFGARWPAAGLRLVTAVGLNLVNGGGLSLVFLVLLFAVPGLKQMLNAEAFMATTIPFFILLSNNTHFAASTVRLYSKPGSYKALPFLTFLFPLIMVLLLTASISQADRIGPFIQAVYLSWSPFHYAAQAYGLGVLYCYRSGCAISIGHKRILWWAALMPFVHNMLAGESTILRLAN